MIKKFKRRFITAATLSIFGLLVLILGVINFINFAVVANDADEIARSVILHEGTLPPIEQGMGEGFGTRPKEEPFQTKDKNASLRYFSVVLGKTDAENEVRMEHISSVSAEDAISWAKSVQNKKVGWFHFVYRYYVAKSPDGRTEVSFVDLSRELEPSYRVLIASIIGVIVGVGIVIVILIFTSKKVVEPLEQNENEKNTFIDKTMNDINNSLSAIMIANAALAKEQKTEETEIIAEEALRIAEITSNFTRNADDEIKEIELGNYLKEFALSYEEKFKDFGKTLTILAEDEVKFKIKEIDLRNILDEIFKNGLDYSLSYFVCLLEKKGSRITIEFKNDCKEQPNQTKELLFEAYVKGEDVGGEHLGLGLYKVKTILNNYPVKVKAEIKNNEFILSIKA